MTSRERLPLLRQIIDPEPNSGAWNMAVDEVLLQTAIDHGLATLRWYQWREPTVSLGYFQQEEGIRRDSRLAPLPRVRRLSGGGTLVHDRELTYSLSLPGSQRLMGQPVELYRLVHQAVIDCFRQRGALLEFRGVTVKRLQEPVLCFEREDENDLVAQGHKVLGSAQRRRKGAILQHGGLLLAASSATPELPGLKDVFPDLDLSNLAEFLGKSISRDLAVVTENESLSPSEIDAVGRLAASNGRLS